MSSPASTPSRRSSRRGRVTPTQSLRSEESRSSPSGRRRGEDSSTGELLPMPTSPGADLQSPAAQNALFSSPPQMDSSAIPLEFDVSSPLTYGTPSSRVEGTPRSGVRGTPMRQRPDLGSARKGLQVDLQSDGAAAEDTVASEQSLGQKLVIWGTDVNVATCKEHFQVLLCALKLSAHFGRRYNLCVNSHNVSQQVVSGLEFMPQRSLPCTTC